MMGFINNKNATISKNCCFRSNQKQVHQKNELYHYWFFKDIGFKFEENVCNKCLDLLTISLSII